MSPKLDFLQQFQPDTGDGFKIEDVELDSTKIVVFRTFPKPQQGGQVRLGAFDPEEFEENDVADVLAEIYGGGGYMLRMTERGAYKKGTSSVRLNLDGKPKSIDESHRALLRFRGIEPEEDLEEIPPAPQQDAPDAWGSYRSQTPPHDPFGRSRLELIRTDEDGKREVVQLAEAFLDRDRADREKGNSDMAVLLQAVSAMFGPILAKMADSKDDTSGKLQIQQMKTMGEINQSALANIFSMQAKASEIMAKTQAEVMGSAMKMLTKIVSEAKTGEGSFLDRLPDLVSGVLEPLSAGKTIPGIPAPGAIGAPAGPAPALAPPSPTLQPSSVPDSPSGVPGDETGGAPPGAKALYAQATVRKWIDALAYMIAVAQPDVDLAWDQSMQPGIDAMPAQIRKKIDALTATSTPLDFAKILLSSGIAPAELARISELAETTEGGKEWLEEFWAAAPWGGDLDDDDFDDDDDEEEPDPTPPFTKTEEAPATPAPAGGEEASPDTPLDDAAGTE